MRHIKHKRFAICGFQKINCIIGISICQILVVKLRIQTVYAIAIWGVKRFLPALPVVRYIIIKTLIGRIMSAVKAFICKVPLAEKTCHITLLLKSFSQCDFFQGETLDVW